MRCASAAPVGTALVLLTGERGWSPGTLSLLLGAFSVAGARGLHRAQRRAPGARTRAVLAVCLALTAVFVTVLGLARPGPGAAVALCALLGAAGGSPAVSVTRSSRDTDPAYIGRVTSVTSLCTLGLSLRSCSRSPASSPRCGGRHVFLAGCGGVCLLAAAFATVKWPRTVVD
ncbi:MFS transporter [Streptomyces sp. KL116D]|uniref:MFS transporter n=1 Tax=Streptomyces sp. KL116D TaxID=3045152 RepID=UPI003557CE00